MDIGLKKWAGTVFIALASMLFFSSFLYAGQDAPGKAALTLRDANKLFEEGTVDKAIEVVRKAIADDQGDPELFDRLGYMLLQKGLFDDSVGAFNSALKLKPNLRTSKTGKGLALLKKGDTKAAEEELTAALSLNPYPSMTYYALGLVYNKMDDFEKAVAMFKEGIRTYKSGKK